MHTHKQTNTHGGYPHRINFKKPSACQPVANTHLVKKVIKIYVNISHLKIFETLHLQDGCSAMQAYVVSNVQLVNHCLLWNEYK